MDHYLPVLETRPLGAVCCLRMSVLATLVGAVQIFLCSSIRSSFVLRILPCFPAHCVSLRPIVGERSYLSFRLLVRNWLATAQRFGRTLP